MRVEFTLQCTECKHENYRYTKNKQTQSGRVEVKKYCPNCNKHTMHKEKK
ncbi:MAG: 50S ribosomal protein L33 [Bacillota bacterium]